MVVQDNFGINMVIIDGVNCNFYHDYGRRIKKTTDSFRQSWYDLLPLT